MIESGWAKYHSDVISKRQELKTSMKQPEKINLVSGAKCAGKRKTRQNQNARLKAISTIMPEAGKFITIRAAPNTNLQSLRKIWAKNGFTQKKKQKPRATKNRKTVKSEY